VVLLNNSCADSGTLLCSESTSGTPEYTKQALKSYLTEEQGYVCGYCGSRINGDLHTTIEHIRPKSTHKAQTYEWDNLIASCCGGSQLITHKVNPDETIADVEFWYGLAPGHFRRLSDQIVTEESLRDLKERYPKNQDLANLNPGDRLVVFLTYDSRDHHCDPKKGNRDIEIDPTQPDCDRYFRYDKASIGNTSSAGNVIGVNEAATRTIEVLGLNQNPDLCRRRANVIEKVGTIIRILMDETPLQHPSRADVLRKNLRQLAENARTRDEKGHRQPYFFVKLSVYQGR
jgi:hypothetical protein